MCFVLVCVNVLVAGHSMIEEEWAGPSLINVSDGLWHWAAERRLSVSCSASQAAQ